MCVATAKAKGQPLGDWGIAPALRFLARKDSPGLSQAPQPQARWPRRHGTQTQFPKDGGFPEASLKCVLH